MIMFSRAEQIRRYKYVQEKFFANKEPPAHYGFRVSSTDVMLTKQSYSELETIASILPGFVNGFCRVIDLSLINDKFRRKSPIFRELRSILGLGKRYESILVNTRKEFSEEISSESEAKILLSQKEHLHPFSRFDLVRNINDELRIVEIEEGKFHGFGYTHLGRELSGSGVGRGLVDLFVELSANVVIGFVLSGYERFYIREVDYFIEQVNLLGGNMVRIYQDEFYIDEKSIGKRTGGKVIKVGALVSLPRFNLPSNEIRKIEALSAQKIADGKLEILNRREPILSRKVAMAVISNPLSSPELESILLDCFEPRVLNTLRQYLPKTYLPRSKKEKAELVERIKAGELFFVKESDSSGAKGVATFTNIDKQVAMIMSNKLVIAQEAITTSFKQFDYMQYPTGARGKDFFSVRYGLFSYKGQLVDLGVTASPSNIAHGSVESIQTGVKVV